MHRPRNKMTRWVRLGIVMLCCWFGLALSGISQPVVPAVLAQENGAADIRTFPPDTTTDRVPPSLEVGQSLYVQTCGSCHIAIPPAVFPSQTWDQLLLDSAHYGAVLEPILEPDKTWIRRYLRFASRIKREGEATPYRFRQSRYFKVLHPQVEMPASITTQTCITCHAKAPEFNFRQYQLDSQLAPSSD